MKQPTSIQIKIPQPCSEDWDKMTPQAKGRFCDSCQKCVVDFTNYSDEELYQYIQENKGKRICGHVHRSQLKRNISLPPQPHSQLYKWIIAAGLALVFVATPEMQTFAKVPYTITQHYDVANTNDSTTTDVDSIVIKGVVLDHINEPAIGAVAKLMVDTNVIGAAVADFYGNFEITVADSIDIESAELSVMYIGYREVRITVNDIENRSNIKVTLEPTSVTGMMGEVILIEYEVPLIDPFEGGNSRTFTDDEIEHRH